MNEQDINLLEARVYQVVSFIWVLGSLILLGYNALNPVYYQEQAFAGLLFIFIIGFSLFLGQSYIVSELEKEQ